MLSVEDRMAIQALYARYAWGMDTGDVAAVLESFTDDGVFDASGEIVTGRAALDAWFRKRFKSRETEPAVNGQHWFTAFDMDGDASTARVRCYFMRPVQSRETSKVEIAGQGWYADELRKIDGAWRFTRKVVSRQMPWNAQP